MLEFSKYDLNKPCMVAVVKAKGLPNRGDWVKFSDKID